MREHIYKAKRKNWREIPEAGWWVEGNILVSDGDYFIIPNFGVSCVEDVDDRICEKMILLHAFEVEKETVKLLKEDDKK